LLAHWLAQAHNNKKKMVIVTGVQSSEQYHPFHPDDIMPPRSIFDPPNEAEDEELSEGGGGWEGGDPGDAGFGVDTATVDLWSVGETLTTWETRDTRDTRDTFSTGLGSPGRRRLRHKHPASLNEVELRIQLWDSYRLARIILGTPIKSFSLRGKTILHSIRKVAEMKLELIRLEKELEMSKVLLSASEQEQQHHQQHQLQQQQQHHSMNSLDTLETPQKRSSHTPSRIDLALVSPEKAKDDNHHHHHHHPDRHDEEEDLTGMATPRRQTRRQLSPAPTLDMVQIQYEQLQETHDQTMKDFQTQLSIIKTHLETTTTSVPSFETVDSTEDAVDGTEPTTQQQAIVVVPHTKKTKKKNDGSVLARAFRKSSIAPPEPFNRAEDTLEAVAAVARDHDINDQSPEELHLRTLLAKKSNSVRTLRSTEPTPADERAKLLQLVEQLMARVEESSQETKLQFDALQQQLELYSSQGMAAGSSLSADGTSIPTRDDSAIFTQQQFQQKLQTARILHKLELETSKSKHIQQVVDLSGQLDAYQHQVDKQNNELQKWRKKFQHLEEMAVTPEEAKDALKELDNLPPHATPDEVAQVQAKVVRVLQRMAQLQTRQQTEQRLMQKTRHQAQAKEAESEYQLEDLKLQHELLKEDTEVPPEVWERQLGTQRRAFEQEMKDLFKREERRMREMELLEVRLTELAFLAVEVEDLELECRQSQEVFSQELTKAQDQYTSTTPMIQALQSQVEHVLLTQRRSLQGLKSSWKRGAEIQALEGRLKDWTTTESPEVLLHRRDEELREVQTTLATRESRIQELEAMVRQLQSEKSP
jgi:hypothetical protein